MRDTERMDKMNKGYVVHSGYMGYIPSEGRYMLFATEMDYAEYMAEEERAYNMSMEEFRLEILRREVLR